jgi:putative membrane protein
MYGFDTVGYSGWWMLAGMAILALAVLGSVWLIVHRPAVGGTPRSSAEEILRERFARGEITGDEFEEAKRRLG